MTKSNDELRGMPYELYVSPELNCDTVPDYLMQPITKYIREDLTRPTVAPTADGDVERALEDWEYILSELSFNKRFDDNAVARLDKFLRTALQSTRKPPVDTIAVPKLMLQGVREQIKDTQKEAIEMHDAIVKNSSPFVWEAWDICLRLQKALASLDAVLSEGE